MKMLYPNPGIDRTVIRSKLHREAGMMIGSHYRMEPSGDGFKIYVQEDPLGNCDQVLQTMGELRKI